MTFYPSDIVIRLFLEGLYASMNFVVPERISINNGACGISENTLKKTKSHLIRVALPLVASAGISSNFFR